VGSEMCIRDRHDVHVVKIFDPGIIGIDDLIRTVDVVGGDDTGQLQGDRQGERPLDGGDHLLSLVPLPVVNLRQMSVEGDLQVDPLPFSVQLRTDFPKGQEETFVQKPGAVAQQGDSLPMARDRLLEDAQDVGMAKGLSPRQREVKDPMGMHELVAEATPFEYH